MVVKDFLNLWVFDGVRGVLIGVNAPPTSFILGVVGRAREEAEDFT